MTPSQAHHLRLSTCLRSLGGFLTYLSKILSNHRYNPRPV